MKKENDSIDLFNDIDLNDLLDKLLILQEGNKKPSFLKKTVYIVSGICVVLFTILICCNIYKNDLSMESILSTLLAFFSIFISIFFYFKADETSTKFYDSSYKFMKEISVTLGKIEERFGEKLNSLNEKVSHLDKLSKEATAEIEDKQEDKETIINELMEKANLNEEEKERYRKELEEKEAEIERLKDNKFRAEREANMLRKRMRRNNEEVHNIFSMKGRNVLYNLLNNGKDALVQYSVEDRKWLETCGYIDSRGNVNHHRIIQDLIADEQV